MRSRLKYLILLTWLLPFRMEGQDHDWWNKKHQWDGITSWTNYLIVSPSFMGPNALPVPEVQKGLLPKERSLELGIDGHYSKGDQTANLFTEFFTPLFSDRAGLKISYVPLEFYQTDTLTRDLRRSREYDARGTSHGDVYIGTYIHILRETEKLPDVLLTVHLKTASGTRFAAARHTDSPGYYFDASLGKKFMLKKHEPDFYRLYGMVGFYAYQTNLDHYFQNDAFLYGAGFDLQRGKIYLENQLGGYTGYLSNGDKPMVYRLNVAWNGDSGVDLKLRFQHGITDFPYTTLRLSTLVNF